MLYQNSSDSSCTRNPFNPPISTRLGNLSYSLMKLMQKRARFQNFPPKETYTGPNSLIKSDQYSAL